MSPAPPPVPLPFEQEVRLLEACKSAMLHTQLRIAESVYHDPTRAFREVRVLGKRRDHVTTRIDLLAQRQAVRFLQETGLPLRFEGEETPRDKRVELRREAPHLHPGRQPHARQARRGARLRRLRSEGTATLRLHPRALHRPEGRPARPKRHPHRCAKAGATITGLDGRPLDLGRALKSGEDIAYLAACNDRLLRDLGKLIA